MRSDMSEEGTKRARGAAEGLKGVGGLSREECLPAGQLPKFPNPVTHRALQNPNQI